GPGDPELLTIRGLRRLQNADVVVHDALVGTGVLALARADAELIDVGKRPGAPVPQELINELLVHIGQSDRNIVRLKGGDPFVFGRGGEEALALTTAGLDFEVVPGISSVIAAPAAAGIPVTHRGVSASFTVVTGHRQRGEPAVNWHALAQAGGTIVVLMGVAQRSVIAAALIEGGLPADTPVAAISHATSSEQYVVRCALSELAGAAVESPATIVIGAVAAFDLSGEFIRGLAVAET
ncbi:MAG: uroporphyrinogen-III C-methyltransferase, partial [Actinomycetota bacterium]|nr:uroporphyrinogen-III C-methyltransferase [Actinomycetota bacterium]